MLSDTQLALLPLQSRHYIPDDPRELRALVHASLETAFLQPKPPNQQFVASR
jgi:hypothetical protein